MKELPKICELSQALNPFNMHSKEFVNNYKATLILALPVCISQLGTVAVNVVDTFMAGILGPVQLASATFGLSVLIPFLMLCIGFSFGITPLVSNAHGAGDTRGIASILKNGLVLNMLFCSTFCGLLYFGTELLNYLDQPPEVLKEGIPFFKIMVLSLLPLQFFQVYKQFAEGLSITKQAMFISLFSNVLNIILNYILIFGKLGFPAYGLMGSGYATLISRIFMALSIWAYVHYATRFEAYRMASSLTNLTPAMLSKIFKISFPIGAQLMFETGAFSFAALMAGWLGIIEIDAHQIALSLAAITYMASTGISAAATIRIGSAYGSKNLKTIKNIGVSAYVLIIIFEICCTIIFIAFRNVLPGLYIENKEIIAMSSSLLLIAAFFQLSDGIQVVGLGILRGLGDVKIPTIIAVISYWLIGLPLGYFFAFKLQFGIQGIWYGLLTGLSFAAILLYLRFRMKVQNF